MPIVSGRVRAADQASSAVTHFYFNSRYGVCRTDPNICDFTFGNPHEFPLADLVKAIGEHVAPQNKDWYAYKTSEREPQAYLAERVSRELGLASGRRTSH